MLKATKHINHIRHICSLDAYKYTYIYERMISQQLRESKLCFRNKITNSLILMLFNPPESYPDIWLHPHHYETKIFQLKERIWLDGGLKSLMWVHLEVKHIREPLIIYSAASHLVFTWDGKSHTARDKTSVLEGLHTNTHTGCLRPVITCHVSHHRQNVFTCRYRNRTHTCTHINSYIQSHFFHWSMLVFIPLYGP